MYLRTRTTTIAGVLFIIATVAALLAASADPILASPNYLVKIAENATFIATDALLYLVAAFSSVGIAISMYPVMKRVNVALSVGSVVFRTIEAVFYIVAIVSLLSLLNLSQQANSSGNIEHSLLQAVGNMLLNLRDQATLLGVFSFSIGAFMYYWLFFQSRLIPRWLSGWGIVAIAMMMIACVLAIYSGDPITGYTILIIPIALQEMVLAIWLLVKGFNSSIED